MQISKIRSDGTASDIGRCLSSLSLDDRSVLHSHWDKRTGQLGDGLAGKCIWGFLTCCLHMPTTALDHQCQVAKNAVYPRCNK